MTHPDDPLRERFQRLRADTESRAAPAFRAMLERAKDAAATVSAPERRVPARRPWLRTAGWASAALAAAVAGLLLTRGRPDPDAEFERLVTAFASDASAGAWRSPTDRLLDVPGRDLMRSLPSVGSALAGGEASGASQGEAAR